MKLLKLLSKPLSSVAGIVGIPDSEEITVPSKKAILTSDDRFTLLQHNHVKTHLIKDFSEVAVVNLGEFDKKSTYVIQEIIKPSEFNSKVSDLSSYKYGDYLFVYSDVDVKHPGEPPKMRKPLPGYSFTPQEYVDALNEYNTALNEYNTELKTYLEAVETFITTGDGSKQEFGWLIQVISKTSYKVIADFSFETTKDTAQFGVMGKLPKDVASKVTQALGGFAKDESIKGLTIAEIIEKTLGLEVEEELVGKIIEKAESTPTVE